MKKNYFYALCLASTFTFAQKMQVLDYSKLDRSDMKTDLFIQHTSPLTPIGKNSTHNNMYTFIQAYKELANNDEQRRMLSTTKLEKYGKNISFAETVKIGLLHTEYESLSKEALTESQIHLNGNQVIRDTDDYIFNKTTSTIIAPLTINKRGLSTKFELESDFYFNNTQNAITSIKANFDDGRGLQTLSFESPIEVDYKTEGQKNLSFEITFADGSTVNKTSSFKVQASNSDINGMSSRRAINEINSTIVPDLSVYDGAASTIGLAEYEVYLGADGVLDKPIFIIDGFDPADGRTTNGIYDLLTYDNNGTQENLGDRIRSEENFDVIIINHPQYFVLADGTLQSVANSTDTSGDGLIDAEDYPGSTLIDGGSDFIERNAMSTIAVINEINLQKSGIQENVVIGPSMGGLISRYALSYMEANGLDHQTRLWLSLDSPHLGANVPIGFQHLFNYLGYGLTDTIAGDQNIVAIRPIVDGMLKSGAARQMLRDQFESHLANADDVDFDPSKLLPESHPFGPIFYNRINNLTVSGYPENTRNISMINGSGVGLSYKNKDGNYATAGQQILDVSTSIDAGALSADADIQAWNTPAMGSTAKVSDISITAFFGFVTVVDTDESAEAPSFSDGIDAAPGGLYDIGALAADFSGDPTIDSFFAGLSSDYFNFIPAVSAMALTDGGTTSWYEHISPRLGAGDEPWDDTTTTNPDTPFVNWYIPTENEDHVGINTANVAFAWEEIVEPVTLGVTDNNLNNTFKLLQNPITNSLTILSSDTFVNSRVTIIDITGKLVYSNTITISDRTTIPLQLASGLYILDVETETENNLRAKVIVE